MKFKRSAGGIAVAAAGALILTPLAPVPSLATPADDNEVINEVYTHGDNVEGVTPASEPTEQQTPEPTEQQNPEPVNNIVSIEEIQGTGPASTMVGQTVTTRGEVTAVYPTGGFNGAYIQFNGTNPNASDAIFIYSKDFAKQFQIGDFVEVTGKVSEFLGKGATTSSTQISPTSFKKIDRPEGVEAITPLELESAPDTEEGREALEGMLLKITKPHTVTDNYGTNRYGTVMLTTQDKPLRQPSDVYHPWNNPNEIAALEAANKASIIALDDGQSTDYTNFKHPNHLIPVPYLNVNDPLRVGSTVTIKKPVILDFRFQWNYQPTEPVNVKGGSDNTDQWIEITNNERPAAPGDFSKAGANLTLTSFNVLNYFTDLGENEQGCKAYRDREGKPVTANYCNVRGAYSKAAFERQQAKIVAAINELDSSIVGLEEIETSSKFGHDRDESLKALVQELNKAAGSEKWAFVPSPKSVPADEDVIRLAYIYQPAEVTPVGDSSILTGSEWFTGYAREPLAQEWQAVDEAQPVGTKFVTVVNHFKSKGSLATKFENDVDEWQGNNNLLRIAQAQEVTNWIAKEYAGKPVILLGDLNSYSKEDPILTIEEAGYTSVADMFNIQNASYLFGARVGSLDHGLANDLAKDLVVGADVWDVNAMEPLAFEYSRYNYNVKADHLFDLTPYRSSDHNPLKMGLKTFEKTPEPTEPEPSEPTVPSETPDEGTVVTPTAPEFINPSASDPSSCTAKPYAMVKEMQGMKYTATVDGKELKANAEGKFVYPYGKTITVKAEPVNGFKFAPDAKTEWSWTATMNEKCNKNTSKPLAKTGVEVGLLALIALTLAGAGVGAVRTSRMK
ncbi:hypothetical protein HMPREF9238_01211 [Gleimia europaea ACS-120-V-Col10b]|uniref:Endonuclease/exonuclease/phosphatase domain-containing protein n=1 Tax=Gleimia europaea ACS-120-V-Col10b TaxID=883069 RepID=A0A9W5RFD2_9ACTO|nr:hypothetical protein HMPREF9238_01211 [Gleimia europaea ACS-120-V-Col10b]